MSNHSPSVSPRQRRVTHSSRETLHPPSLESRKAAIRLTNQQMIKSASDLFSELTSPPDSLFAGFPGVTHTRFSHLRTDQADSNCVYRLLALLAARAAIGEVDGFERVAGWLLEWRDRLRAIRPRLALSEQMTVATRVACEAVVAKVRAADAGNGTAELMRLRARARAAAASYSLLALAIDDELAGRLA